MVMIRVARARHLCLLLMGVMVVLRDFPGRRFRRYRQRIGMPGPGHKHGENKCEYHCRCQGSTEHSIRIQVRLEWP